jgi:metal-responsive CopG/Arc/MetJ family transcriptional regulator
MFMTLDTRPPRHNVRVTTDLDRATADRLHNVIERMQCTRAEFIRALVHAYLNRKEQD